LLYLSFTLEGEGGYVYTVGIIEKGSNLKFEFKFQVWHICIYDDDGRMVTFRHNV